MKKKTKNSIAFLLVAHTAHGVESSSFEVISASSVKSQQLPKNEASRVKSSHNGSFIDTDIDQNPIPITLHDQTEQSMQQQFAGHQFHICQGSSHHASSINQDESSEISSRVISTHINEQIAQQQRDDESSVISRSSVTTELLAEKDDIIAQKNQQIAQLIQQLAQSQTQKKKAAQGHIEESKQPQTVAHQFHICQGSSHHASSINQDESSETVSSLPSALLRGPRTEDFDTEMKMMMELLNQQKEENKQMMASVKQGQEEREQMNMMMELLNQQMMTSVKQGQEEREQMKRMMELLNQQKEENKKMMASVKQGQEEREQMKMMMMELLNQQKEENKQMMACLIRTNEKGTEIQQKHLDLKVKKQAQAEERQKKEDEQQRARDEDEFRVLQFNFHRSDAEELRFKELKRKIQR